MVLKEICNEDKDFTDRTENKAFHTVNTQAIKANKADKAKNRLDTLDPKLEPEACLETTIWKLLFGLDIIKVKYKRKERGSRATKPAPPSSDWEQLRLCQGSAPPSACWLGGVVFTLTCLGSLLYLIFTLTDKLQVLESRISSGEYNTVNLGLCMP